MIDNTEDQDKIEVLVGNNVQTIFDHLNDLEKDSPVYAKRWFWELLQNAKDAVDDDQLVSVKVKLDGHTLTFSHTGDPFKRHDVLHLIYHGSSKKSLENKTGRFGTGFMSTHLLSRIVQITGKLENGNYFDFKLDRTGKTIGEQYTHLEESYERFKSSYRLNTYSDGIFDTVFTYVLPPDNLYIATDGLDQLEKILPFVMAFNPKIEQIEVDNNGKFSVIERSEDKSTEFKGKKVFEQGISYNKTENKVVFIKDDSFDIGVLLIKNDDESFSVVDIDDAYPKLFFDFPLFGTEKLGIPAVINSNCFDLKKERDGVYLLEDDKNKHTIINNKKIITSAFDCLEFLIAYTTQSNYNDLFNLFKVKKAFEYSWLYLDWLNGLSSKLIDTALELVCLPYAKDDKLSLNTILVPWSSALNIDSFYNLILDIKPGFIPKKQDNHEWIEVAFGYASVQDRETGDYSFIIDEHKLCKILQKASTLDNVSSMLVSDTSTAGQETQTDSEDDDVVAWFNRFLAMLSKDQTEQLTSAYAFMPNQYRKLVSREVGSLFLDEIGNETIKTVAEGLKFEIKSTLIFQGIIPCTEVFQSSTLDKVLTILTSKCHSITEDDLNEKQKRTGLISFLGWLIDNKKNDLIKESYVIIEKGREAGEVNYAKRRLFSSASDKLIAPTSIWPSFSLYAEILPKKYIMITEVADLLNLEQLEYLCALDLIYLSPLQQRRKPGKNDLKLLAGNTEGYLSLLNDKEEIVENDLEYSDIIYLNKTDENVLAKTAEGVKNAKALFNFLLSQVIIQDKLFNSTSIIDTGQTNVPVGQCLWIARLRDISWVPFRPLAEEKTLSERPSVANITQLLKDDAELLAKLKRREAGQFFNQIGISIADIRRNSLTNDEDKLNWDMAFSELIGNGNIRPDLAVEMLADPNLQEQYLARKRQKENISRNQGIGSDFEKAFSEIFSQEAYKDDGFSIKRVPLGSDYGIIYEEDIIDENGNEVLFQIKDILIELKATGKLFAEMTEKQAETASKNINRYVLAVLPLEGYEINQQNVVLHSRFVVDIAKPLLNRFNDFTGYKQKKNEVTMEKADVKLNIEDGSTRYQVKSDIWRAGINPLNGMQASLSFYEFVKWLKTAQ